MERTVELHALLREMLLLRHDAVHVVVAHFQPVGSGLAVRSGIGSRSTCQTVECVIRIGMRHLSARLSAFGKCGLVGNAEHVAHGIVGIAIVHDGFAACVDRQVLQPAACGLVGVEGLRTVAVFQVGALLELVIADAVHVVIAVGLVAAYLLQLTAEVVGVSDLLLVRVDHLQEAVVAVVGPLRHIGGNRLVGHNQRAAGLGDFAHLAVEVLDGTRSVLTEHQATDAVLRGVASAVVILHVVLRVVGIVDARQPVIIVVVGDGLAFLGKVGSLLGQHIAECIIREGGDAACRMVHLGAAVPHVIYGGRHVAFGVGYIVRISLSSSFLHIRVPIVGKIIENNKVAWA